MINMTGWGMIEALSEDEGDSVTIISPNPEGLPDYVIICNGYWTDWEDLRVEGNSRLECLSNAVERMRKAKEKRDAPIPRDE